MDDAQNCQPCVHSPMLCLNRASPKGFEKGLNQKEFGLNPPFDPPPTPPPLKPPKPPFKPPLEHRGGGGRETKVKPWGVGLNNPLNYGVFLPRRPTGDPLEIFWRPPGDPQETPRTALPQDRPSPGPPLPWTALPQDRWWCLKRQGAQMCTFGLSGCRVKKHPEREKEGIFWWEEKKAPNIGPTLLGPPPFEAPPFWAPPFAARPPPPPPQDPRETSKRGGGN